ncbi:hypothetical protein D3C81_1806270 [compost metagenome]
MGQRLEPGFQLVVHVIDLAWPVFNGQVGAGLGVHTAFLFLLQFRGEFVCLAHSDSLSCVQSSLRFQGTALDRVIASRRHHPGAG